MNENILKFFLSKGFLLDKEMLDFFSELKDDEIADKIASKIKMISGEKLITKHLINNNFDKLKQVFTELDKNKKRLVEKYFVNISVSVEVKKETSIENKEVTKSEDFGDILRGSVKILSSPILSAQKLEAKDFIRYFRSRYNFLREIVQQRHELDNLISIDKITGNKNFSLIGIVMNKIITKNKNVILEVEDLTGSTKLLITQNKEEIYKKSKEILMDDVVGFRCSGTKDFIYVNDVIYPDSFLRERHRLEDDIYCIFISDIHVGSGNFLEAQFNKFIEWLNGKDCDEKEKVVLRKIRYLFIVGDSIDGVGVYPGQEKFLKIKDIREQYVKLAEFLKKIPKHISIIHCPGQHDSVRVAEPQPPVGEDFAKPLHEIENLHLVSNPSLVEIGARKDNPGIKVLMYHGASMHDLINNIEELRLSKAQTTPARVVKHFLLRRHLSPSHGESTYIPDAHEDSLVIREVPDIIVTGDLHRADIDKYNGILIVCCSCWQSMTAFEEKVGNVPDLCKVPVVNLKTGEIKILDFE